MTTELTLWGECTSALDLLVPVGLTAILDEAGLGPSFFFWDADAAASRARVVCSASSIDEIGEAVRLHAERHTAPDSWVQARIHTISNAGKGLFSPRASIKPGDWDAYLAQRAAWLAAHEGSLTELDWAMLAGLGEPAWWRADDKDAQPDKGASRWEMKTRNRGEEFITNRLQPLADSVSRRSGGQVLAGLTTQMIVADECGGGSPMSRTPTGLTIPQPTDNARAWAALWGLSGLPTVAVGGGSMDGFSQSPCVWPRRRVHPTEAVLPVVTRPCTWRHFRALITSSALDAAAFRRVNEALDARSWLRTQGVVAIARLPIKKTGSDSAPERQMLSASIDVLDHA